MAELKNKITLVVGDWSLDGHNIMEKYVVSTNLPCVEVERAYEVGTKLVGFDLTKDVASKYADNTMSLERYNKLLTLGFRDTQFVDPVPDDGKIYFSGGEGFRDMYLFIVKLGNDDFEYVIEESNEINIGGYGLYDL